MSASPPLRETDKTSKNILQDQTPEYEKGGSALLLPRADPPCRHAETLLQLRSAPELRLSFGCPNDPDKLIFHRYRRSTPPFG